MEVNFEEFTFKEINFVEIDQSQRRGNSKKGFNKGSREKTMKKMETSRTVGIVSKKPDLTEKKLHLFSTQNNNLLIKAN